MELRRTYDPHVGALEEKLQMSVKRAVRLHICASLQYNSPKKEIGTLEKANYVLHTNNTKVTAKARLGQLIP